MDAIEAVTCVRFKVRKYEKDYVNIHSGQFCKSYLGRIGGPQEMSLNNKSCFQKGIIIHELLHALGYIHTQSQPDRDAHVKILWQNIMPRFYSEFAKIDVGMYNTYGTPYDYQSIMHYGPTAFTINGARTIVPIDSSYADVIGQRTGLSDGDVRRINMKYKCHEGRSNSLSSFEEARELPSFNALSSYDEKFPGYNDGENGDFIKVTLINH